MKTNSRERMFVLIGGLIVVVTLLFNVLNPPKANGQKSPLLSAEEAKHRKETALTELKTTIKEQERLQEHIVSLVSKRAPDEVIPRLIRDLQRIAKQANVHLTETKAQQRPRTLSTSHLEKVSVEIRLRAPFQPNVMQFFYLLEAPEGKMVIDNFRINQAEARLKTVDVSATISVYTRAVSSGANEGETSNVSKP